MSSRKRKHEGNEASSDVWSRNETFYEDAMVLDTSVSKKKKKKKDRDDCNENTSKIMEEHTIDFTENEITTTDDFSPKQKKKKKKDKRNGDENTTKLDTGEVYNESILNNDMSPKKKKKKKHRNDGFYTLTENVDTVSSPSKENKESDCDLSPKQKKKKLRNKSAENITKLVEKTENEAGSMDDMLPKQKKKIKNTCDENASKMEYEYEVTLKKKKEKNKSDENTTKLDKEVEAELLDNMSPKQKKKNGKNKSVENTTILDEELEAELLDNMSPKQKKKNGKNKSDENTTILDEELEAELLDNMSPKQKKKNGKNKSVENTTILDEELETDLMDVMSPQQKKKMKDKNKADENTAKWDEELEAELIDNVLPKQKKKKDINKSNENTAKWDEELEAELIDNMSPKKKKVKNISDKNTTKMNEKYQSKAISMNENPSKHKKKDKNDCTTKLAREFQSEISDNESTVNDDMSPKKMKKKHDNDSFYLETENADTVYSLSKENKKSYASISKETLNQSKNIKEKEFPDYEEMFTNIKEENISIVELNGKILNESGHTPSAKKKKPEDKKDLLLSQKNSPHYEVNSLKEKHFDFDVTIDNSKKFNNQRNGKSLKNTPVECILGTPSKQNKNPLSSSSDDSESTTKIEKRKKKYTKPRHKVISSLQVDDEFSSIDSEFERCVDEKLLNDLDDSEDDQELKDQKVFQRLQGFEINSDFEVHAEHTHEKKLGLRGCSEELKSIFKDLQMKTNAKFSPAEDEIIKKNWKRFSKIYVFEEDETYYFTKIRRGTKNVMPISHFVKFAQFLGQGLPKRPLQSIFYRFTMLYKVKVTKTGRFSEKEDETIKKFMEGSPSRHKFLQLSRVLNRCRKSIYHRFLVLSNFTSENAHAYRSFLSDPTLLQEIIKLIMEVSGCKTVQELYTVDIPWSEIKDEHPSKTHILRYFWMYHLYTALKIKESVYTKDVEEKLIEILKQNNEIQYQQEINWKELCTTHFPDFHFVKLSRMFSLCKMKSGIHGFKMKLKDMLMIMEKRLCISMSGYCIHPIVTKPDGTVLSCEEVVQKEFQEQQQLLGLDYKDLSSSSDED